MKVLMTVYPDGVVWPFALELTRALEHDGVTFSLAVMEGPLQDVQRAELRTLSNVEFYESTFHPLASDEELERASVWLLELAARCDVDIIHLNELCFGALPWGVRPLLHAVRAEPISERAQVSLRAAGSLVTPARALLSELQAYCAQSAIACVIPPGRTIDSWPDVAKEEMIAGVGDASAAAANLRALGRSAARLSWPVFLLADPPTQATPFVNAHFLGNLPAADRKAVLARAGIFARPASVPGYSYDVLDAARCGCALVLADTPELREQWDGAAAFVTPDDDESLHATLLRIMNDADARLDLGTRARQRASNNSAEKMAAAYLTIYIELALRSSSVLYERVSGQAPLDWSA